MRRTGFGPILAAIASLFVAAPASASEPARIPVEVWATAHDELTNRLSAAISVALNESPAFASSVGKKPGSLYVTITDRVHWKIMGTRALLSAPVALARRPPNAPAVMSPTVSCRDDLLQNCASQVLVYLVSLSASRAARSAPPGTQSRDIRLALNSPH